MWASARKSWKSLRAFPSPLALHHISPYSFFRKARPKGEEKEKMRRFGWLSLEKNKLFSAFRRERSAVRREKSAVRREKIRSEEGKDPQQDGKNRPILPFRGFFGRGAAGEKQGNPAADRGISTAWREKSCRSSLCQEERRGCRQDFQGKIHGSSPCQEGRRGCGQDFRGKILQKQPLPRGTARV